MSQAGTLFYMAPEQLQRLSPSLSEMQRVDRVKEHDNWSSLQRLSPSLSKMFFVAWERPQTALSGCKDSPLSLESKMRRTKVDKALFGMYLAKTLPLSLGNG